MGIRRRPIVALVILLAASALGCGGPRPGESPAAPPPPPAEPGALGQGRLALAWGEEIRVLDGETGELRSLGEAGGVPTRLAWSPGGDWIAYTVDAGGASRLFLVRADGRARQDLSALIGDVTVDGFDWSPVRDVLAVVARGSEAQEIEPGLWLIEPGQPEPEPRRLSAGDISQPRWSPQGDRIAFVRTEPAQAAGDLPDDLLLVVPVSGQGTGEIVHRALRQAILLPGWWPDGAGLLFWPLPQRSASLAADGLLLHALPLDGGLEAGPIPLVWTLTYPNWIAWLDAREVLVVESGGRAAWSQGPLTRCSVQTGACAEVPAPPDRVAIDPAVSPDGMRVAFVSAERIEDLGGERTAGWEASRTLQLWDLASGEMTPLAAGGGVFGPRWLPDSRRLLYVRQRSVWLLEAAPEAVPVRLVGPLPEPAGLFSYYGHADWHRLVDLWIPPDPRR